MKWEIVRDYEELSELAANLLLSALASRPRVVLGLPTGSTPEGMYRHVVVACQRSYRCFQDAMTFNLDEYAGIPQSHPGSYCSYMQERLFRHVDLRPENIHIPDGMAVDPRAKDPTLPFGLALEEECRRYEESLRAVGGLQLTFLGLGRNGHIAFNEPGSSFDSRTRVVRLDESTRAANAAFFPDGPVPDSAITMGLGTIMESERIIVLAAGEGKRAAVARLRAGEIDRDMPASVLHRHDAVTVIVDRAAGEA